MPKILEIKKLKRLYKLTFDMTPDALYVCEDSVIKFFLSKDKLLSTDQLKELTDFDQFARGKSLAIYYLGFKARTEREVVNYLLTHEINSAYLPQILAELKALGLLDDSAYAENFIHGKIALNAAGPYQIRQKLREKGLADEILDQKLAELFDESTQLKVAGKLAEKLIRSKAHRLPLKQLKIKITQSLVNKGFSYDIAQQTLDKLELEADEETENSLLLRELDKVASKYSRNYEGYELKNKVTQALMRKGFDYSAIRDAVDNYEF